MSPTTFRFFIPIALLIALLQTNPLEGQEKRQRENTQDQATEDTNQIPQRIDVKFEDGEKKPFYFLQFQPDQYSAEGEAMPLMIFLHGRGECGNDLELVKTWGPPRIVQEKKDFPFVVISPQCPKPGWDQAALKGLLRHVVATLNVDAQRIYITGLSMGGYGTWQFAADNSDKIAAAIPICGGGHAANCENLKNIPIWAFHGDDDQVVPLSEMTNIVNAIKDVGGDKVKLTIYEGVGHNSWKQTYENPAIYEWLLKQERNGDN